MSTQTCVVAVDVGNSAAKLCVRRGESTPTELDFRVSIRQDDWQAQAIQWVYEHAGCQQTHWRIASVNQAAATSLSSAVEENTGGWTQQPRVDFISRHDVPMKVLVDQPDRLGIDRLLSAYGAKMLHADSAIGFGADSVSGLSADSAKMLSADSAKMLHADSAKILRADGTGNRFDAPLVVVDAGSAVTIDWVDASGQFCGGAIMPGLRMQADALAKGTDALPVIDWQSWKCGAAPATNTIDAIRLGLVTGISASIDRLAELYAQQAKSVPKEAVDGKKNSSQPRSPMLVLTGGDASLISPYVQHQHDLVPNLVCRGVLALP